MPSPFKPLLGEDIDFSLAKWPMYMSPKLDGIRAMIRNGELVTRSLKAVPNEFIRTQLSHPDLEGLDGELIVGSPTDPDCYNTTQSAVMKRKGEPKFTFYVFDDFVTPTARFDFRYQLVSNRVEQLGGIYRMLMPLSQQLVSGKEEAEFLYEQFLAAGYEGAMFRDPAGPYKFGRSTARACTLLKWKPLEDSEAEIVGVYEQMHNGNEATKDALGHTKRSSHQENKTGKGTVGGFHARDIHSGVEFDVGVFKGATADDRVAWWNTRDALIGRMFKYTSLKIGVKDKPRHPRWIGWRTAIDM